jgi:hypothetical protein
LIFELSNTALQNQAEMPVFILPEKRNNFLHNIAFNKNISTFASRF